MVSRERQYFEDNGGVVLNYKEAVEKQLSEDADEQKRRKLLWEDIVAAYDRGGEDEVKSALTAHAEKITKDFKEMLNQLMKKI